MRACHAAIVCCSLTELLQRIKERKVLEDDNKGFQRIMVEHEAEWRFLRVFHGTFTTALEVLHPGCTCTNACEARLGSS